MTPFLKKRFERNSERDKKTEFCKLQSDWGRCCPSKRGLLSIIYRRGLRLCDLHFLYVNLHMKTDFEDRNNGCIILILRYKHVYLITFLMLTEVLRTPFSDTWLW